MYVQDKSVIGDRNAPEFQDLRPLYVVNVSRKLQ